MSFSFSQPQTSSFLAPNELLDLERLRLAPQEAADVHQNRMLEAQTSQRNISAFDMEQAGRIAGSVLDETTYPTPEARAAAYPTLVARARANGAILPHAPDTYPGDDVMRSIFRMAMPAKDLYAQGQAGQAASDFGSRWGTQPPATGGGAATAAPAGGGGTNAPAGTSTPTAPQNVADIHPDLTQFSLPSGVGLTVAKSAAPQFQGLLTDLEAAGYKLDPNSTGGYNPRNIAGTNTPSQHAHGLAIDVNWQRNPRGANTQADIPPDLARKLAAKWGLTWGGDWQGADRDPMHFEVARGSGSGTDHPSGVATGWNANNPLNLTTDTGGVVTPGGARLATYGSMADGVAATAAKLQSYQTDRGLDTVRKMYTEWHKGSQVNDADMQRIAGAVGVGVDQPFQLDPTKTAAWITAAQPGETGTAGKRLSPADITAGVRQAIATPTAPPGGVAARTGGTDVAGPGAGTGGPPAAPAPLPPQQAVAQARSTGQPVPVAGTQGLWALPNGNLTSTPPAATAAQAPPAQQPAPSQPPAPAPTAVQPTQPVASGSVAIPPPEPIVANGLTATQLAEIPSLKRDVQLGHKTVAEADATLLKYQADNRAAQRQYALDVQGQQEKAVTAQRQAHAADLADRAAARADAEAAQKAETAGRPYQGSGIEAQDANILLGGDDGSARYAGAYSRQAAPRVNVDGSTVIPNMTAYDKPTYRGGKGQAADGAPDYGTVKTTPPTQMNATQSLAAGFADRMRNALPVISDTSEAAMNRWQVLRGKAPVIGNSLVSSEFQQHMQAERDFINAVLRRESGAAISEPEFVNARAQYIPQPGDEPAVLAQKQRNRETVMANLVRDAGPAYKPPATTAAEQQPVSVKTPDEAQSLPSGTVYKTPDGRTFKR